MIMSEEENPLMKIDGPAAEPEALEPDEKLSKSNKSANSNPKWRYLMLALACSTNIGIGYSADMISGIETQLEEGAFSLTSTQYTSLYSLLYAPSIIFPIFGGILSDKLGANYCLLMFCVLGMIGQAITTYSLYCYSYALLLIGRLFLSVMDLILLSQYSIVSHWFDRSQAGFPFAMIVVVGRTATVSNAFFTPLIYSRTQVLWYPGAVGLVLCVCSLIAAILLVIFDAPPQNTAQDKSNDAESEGFFAGIKSLKRIAWIVFINITVSQSTFLCFMNQANDHLYQVFGFTNEEAGRIVMVVYIMGIIFIPLVGKLVDRYGKRPIFAIFGMIFLTVSQAIFLCFSNEQNKSIAIMAMVFIGAYYFLYAGSVWPVVPMVVEKKHTGVALGAVNSMLHLGLVVLCTSLGGVRDKTSEIQDGYFYFEAVLLATAVVGLITTIWVYFEDRLKFSSHLMAACKK